MLGNPGSRPQSVLFLKSLPICWWRRYHCSCSWSFCTGGSSFSEDLVLGTLKSSESEGFDQQMGPGRGGEILTCVLLHKSDLGCFFFGFFVLSFWCPGNWSQGLSSHCTTYPALFIFIWDKVYLRWAYTCDHPSSASQVSRIIDLGHWASYFLINLFQLVLSVHSCYGIQYGIESLSKGHVILHCVYIYGVCPLIH